MTKSLGNYLVYCSIYLASKKFGDFVIGHKNMNFIHYDPLMNVTEGSTQEAPMGALHIWFELPAITALW